MSDQDIRWIQRFNHYAKALSRLEEAVKLSRERELSSLEEQGLIQAFEFTHELAWNTMRDFLRERGAKDIYGSKDATREAFKIGLIDNGHVWMDMIRSRNLTSHTYNEETAEQIASRVYGDYITEFEALSRRLDELKSEEIG